MIECFVEKRVDGRPEREKTEAIAEADIERVQREKKLFWNKMSSTPM